MSLDRRFLMCALAALALLAGASSAIAKSHASHGARITGVVVSINAGRHTLKLRVSAATSSRRATARAAAAGSRIVTVAFGDASVSGPGGAVVVGDDVTVTTAGPAGQSTVAASIAVIGQPNGGDAGKGAALAGEVTAVDPSAQTLTMQVDSTDAQGGSQPATVAVSVSSTTVLGLADTGGDGKITIADIAVGDHIVVFTQDATASPIVAVGILDSGHGGGDHQGGGDPPAPAPAPTPPVVAPTPVYDAFAGTVAGIGDGSVRVTVSGDGPLGGETVTVAVNSSTRYKGATTNEQSFTFSDIQVGDQVRVYATTLDPQDLVAVFIGDGQSDGQGSTGASGPPAPTPPAPSPPSSTPVRFGGVVTAVRGDGLTVTALNGPLEGQSVIVSVPSTASFQADPVTHAGTSLATISLGDAVEIYTHSESSSPVVAVGVSDDGVYTAA